MAAIVVSLCVASNFGTTTAKTVKADRYSATYSVLLVFELQDDSQPSAAVVVNAAPQPPQEAINILLLFPSKSIDTNERGLVRTGFYDRWTMMSFSGLGSSWPQQISFVPGLIRSTDPTVVDNQPDGGAFLVAQGQVRRFTYRYPETDEIDELSKRAGGVLMTTPTAIAITLPDAAEEKPVASGQLTVPMRIDRHEHVFPGSPIGGERYLKIAYEMPPSQVQILVVEWGLKIAAALLPISLLLFVDRKDLTNPGLRRLLAIGAALVMLSLFAVSIWGGVTTGNLVKVMPDILLIIISAVGSVITLMLKKD